MNIYQIQTQNGISSKKLCPSKDDTRYIQNISLIKRCFTLLLAVVLISGCQTSSPSKTAGQHDKPISGPVQLNKEQIGRYQESLRLLQAKDYSSAESILLELSEVQPNFAGSWLNLGLIKLMTKQPTQAKTFVEKALTLTPEHSQALNLMGLIATHDRDIKLAERYYLKAIEHSAQYANAHYNLALLYDVYLQNIRKAVKYYQGYLEYAQIEDKQTQDWVEHLQSSLTN